MKHLDDKLSIGVVPASIAKAHKCPFVYSVPLFAGNSVGAIILQNGRAIGIHTKTVIKPENAYTDECEIEKLWEIDLFS